MGESRRPLAYEVYIRHPWSWWQGGLVGGVDDEHGSQWTHSGKPEKHVQLGCDSCFLRRKLCFFLQNRRFHLQTIACSQEVMHFVFLEKMLGVGLFQNNLLELDLQATLSLRSG